MITITKNEFKINNRQPTTSSISSDGVLIAHGYQSGEILIINREKKSLVKKIRAFELPIRKIVFSPNSNNLTAISSSRNIKIWDTKTYDDITIISESETLIADIEFSPNSEIISFSSKDGYLYFWDINNATVIDKIKFDTAPLDITFSNDSEFLSLVFGRKIFLWSIEKKESLAAISAPSDSLIYTSKFSPDGLTLAAKMYDNSLAIWDIAELKLHYILSNELKKSSIVNSAPSAKKLVIGKNSGETSFWDFNNFSPIKSKSTLSTAKLIAVSSEGTKLIYKDKNSLSNTIYIYDLNTKESTPLINATKAVFSQNGEIIATTSHNDQITISIYNLLNKEEIKKISIDLNLLRDRTHLYPAGKGRDMFKGIPEAKNLNKHLEISVKFSPDSLYLAYITPDGKVNLSDVYGFSKDKNFQHTKTVNDFAFSPDGKVLTTVTNTGTQNWDIQSPKYSSNSKTIHLWDINTQKLIKSLSGHVLDVLSIEYLNDTTIITSSKDHTLRTWNIIDGKQTSLIFGDMTVITEIQKIRDELVVTKNSNSDYRIINTSNFQKILDKDTRLQWIKEEKQLNGFYIKDSTYTDDIVYSEFGQKLNWSEIHPLKE